MSQNKVTEYDTIEIGDEPPSAQQYRRLYGRYSIMTKIIIAGMLIIVTLICVVSWSLVTRSESNEEPIVTETCTGTVYGKNGVVSSANPYATQAGISILEAGGNAFDAAAAVQFMLNVVRPQSNGIGGGCFIMMYKSDTGDTLALDGREEAPNNFSPDAFCTNPSCDASLPFRERTTGGHPVGVPGTVAAIRRMLKDHGTKSLSEVITPAIERAKEGFPMYEHLLDKLVTNTDRTFLWDATVDLFYPNRNQETGEPEPPLLGEIWKNPDLADTFQLLADEKVGEDSFYQGQIAKDIVSAVKNAVHPTTKLGGLMEEEDLNLYRAVYREPIQGTYRDYKIFGMPPPSSGGLSLQMMLNILERSVLSSMNQNGTEHLQRIIDAQDIVWADRRTYMGDADFVDVPFDGLNNKTYAYERSQELIHAFQSARASTGGTVPPGNPTGAPDYISMPKGINDRHGTTHFVVVDKDHNIVSMTTTIEANLGSSVVVPGRGFLLNNELTDFESLPADEEGRNYSNAPAGGKRPRRTALGAYKDTLGGKRPLSSMSPTIIMKNDEPYLTLGSPGGSRIIGTVLTVLIGALDHNPTCLSEAVNIPRAISRNAKVDVEIELLVDHAVEMDALEQRNFEIQLLNDTRPLGYCQAVRFGWGPNNLIEGVADQRRNPLATALAL